MSPQDGAPESVWYLVTVREVLVVAARVLAMKPLPLCMSVREPGLGAWPLPLPRPSPGSSSAVRGCSLGLSSWKAVALWLTVAVSCFLRKCRRESR